MLSHNNNLTTTGAKKPCPNCEATMNEGEACPECTHTEIGRAHV